jgi:hypothetical protein
MQDHGGRRPPPPPSENTAHDTMDATDDTTRPRPHRAPASLRPDRAPAALAAVLALAACGDGDRAASPCPYPADGPRPVHEVADPGRWLSDVPTWHVREDAVLGAASPDGDGVVLEGVDDAATGPGGRTYVADGAAGRVWTFDADGDAVGRLGDREGSPGTPGGHLEVGVGPGDTLRAFDPGRLLETTFDSAGRRLDTAFVSPEGGFGPAPEVAYGRRGELHRLGWGGFVASLEEALGGRDEGIARGEVDLQRLSRGDGTWTTLARVPSVEVRVTERGLADAPFAPRPLWDAVDEGLWWADSREYLLTRLSADGDTLCRVRVDVDAPRVSGEDRRRFREAGDVDPYSHNLRQKTRRARKDVPIPDRRPALRGLVGADDGGVWVRPAPERWGTRPDSATWHAFDAEGRLVARVRLPADLRPLEVGRDRVLGVRSRPAGLEHVDRVVRLEVVREGS